MSSNKPRAESVGGDDLRLIYREIARLRSDVADLRSVQRSLTMTGQHDYSRGLASHDWLKLDRFWESSVADRVPTHSLRTSVARLMWWEMSSGEILDMNIDAAALAVASIATADRDSRVLLAGASASSARAVLEPLLAELGISARLDTYDAGEVVDGDDLAVICVLGDDPLEVIQSLVGSARLTDNGLLLVACSDFEFDRAYRTSLVEAAVSAGLVLSGHWRSVLIFA